MNDRLRRLQSAIRSAAPAVCAERAVLVTRYFRRSGRKPTALRKAEALAYALRNKQVRVYPDELLVGCFTSHRVGGGIYPELHGVAMLEDLLRKTSPLAVSKEDRRRLLTEVLPYWLPRFLALKAKPLWKSLRLVMEQSNPTRYLINEAGGIAHFVPDYERLLAWGTDGYRQRGNEAIRTVCDGLDAFADGYRREALRLGRADIAEVCERVPRFPARTFREALQSILFVQIALNLESLDNGISPGRLDQVLWPYYRADRLTRESAFELLGCFALKLCEIVPALSRRITRFHGGLMSGQAVIVGGQDREGNDATNELTYLILDVINELRARQPNWHARIHGGSPLSYRKRIAEVVAAGGGSPAVYNDDVIIPILKARGIEEEDARDYATVGCVEPVAAGRSFLSTDAALFNVPLCLGLALRGAESCASTEEVIRRFQTQLEKMVARLLDDLQAVERANARLHPTPLTSMLLRGCLESGRDATAGGARYNGSGVQGVGVVEVGDSFAAMETVVFRDRRAAMAEVVRACRAGFRGFEALRARLLAAPKYGNDDRIADGYVARVMELFAACLAGRETTRGGRYVVGFYSMTSHQAFGARVGALPNGRLPGEPFASGLAPENGLDRLGPTAALRSFGGLPLHAAINGVNYNLKLAPWAADALTLQALIAGGFASGAMQMQVNVLDPKILIEARDHPGRYPGLLVRVSGYSAYFDDLAPEMKDEIIRRTAHEALLA